MGHRIEVFTDDTQTSRQTLVMVEVGKCAGCELIERNLASDASSHQEAVQRYGITTTPTIVIDGVIKVEGKPDFAWMCGDEFYADLKQRYPLHPTEKNPGH